LSRGKRERKSVSRFLQIEKRGVIKKKKITGKKGGACLERKSLAPEQGGHRAGRGGSCITPNREREEGTQSKKMGGKC